MPRGGKKCVHDRVDEYVAVAVRNKSAFRRDLHAAERDMIARCSESVGVNADARAKLCHAEVLPKGQFDVGSLTRKQPRRSDVFGKYARIVGKDVLRRDFSVCRKQLRKGKALRCLHKKSAFPVELPADHAVRCGHQRIGAGQGADRTPEGAQRLDAITDDLRGNERTRRVVDKHVIGRSLFFCKKFQCVFHRFRARGATAYQPHVRKIGKKRQNFRTVAFADADADLPDLLIGGKSGYRAPQYGDSVVFL